MGRLATWSIIVGSFITAGLAGYSFGRFSAMQNAITGGDTAALEPLIAMAPSVQPPLAMVVPHHNIVAQQRAEAFAELARQTQPQTIVVLSPNHFGSGIAERIVANKTWTRNNGLDVIKSNDKLVAQLVAANVVTQDNAALAGEHGISNLLDDIGAYFPKAQLVPILLRDTVTADMVDGLMTELTVACADQCGVIASVDMSHYLPAALADVHDQTTVRVLREQNQTDVWELEVDSPASLAGVMQWARLNHLPEFVVQGQTNSGTLLGNPDIETTSHILGYYQPSNVVPADTSIGGNTADDDISADTAVTTFTFAGDVMLGREIGYQFQNNNFRDLFTNLGNRVFWGTDIAWLNVEGPISDRQITQDRTPDDLIFLFSREAVAALEYLQITTAGLANNHTANQGRAGLETTRQLLDAAKIDWVGDPSGVNESSVKRYSRGGNEVSLIAVNVFDGDLTGLTELIESEHAAGQFVIVMPHWGNEYQTTHSSRQEQLATEWVNAGADLIIGMHPHVVQDVQVLTAMDGRRGLVLYSLGNFVFDQTFSAETQQGLIAAGSITPEAVRVALLPVISRKLKPELARGEIKQALIDRICADISQYCSGGVLTVVRK